ncbi:GH1 family beta-glucosidase [Niveibacterium sp.]|uniref:GH1 family beta-glucosidase n=1 Tax=Niveibacterium sp. TaxID=2017444 RepID=UPI0035B1B120
MKTTKNIIPEPKMKHLFPADFAWGVATSAYQIEGATQVDGRGPSIWDTFSHTPGKTDGGDTGDVACEHYYRYREDIALMREMGVTDYRFSCAWPRVQPTGSGAWNEAGWDFYARVLDALDEAGIAAHATLYHWDLPQPLEDAGGWRNRETCARFAEYAAEFARRFGSRVKTIATHNEPWCTATLGHETGQFAPGLRDRAAAFLVSHHLLLSHGMALRAMRAAGCKAQLGIVLNQSPAYPANPDSEADRRAARIADGLSTRWYMDPLFRGAYPADVVAYLGADAPQPEPGDMAIIGEPMDFLGLNYYMRSYCSGDGRVQPPGDRGFTDMDWEVYPEGLTEHLVRLARAYNPPPLYITENGAATADTLEGDAVHDSGRVNYLRWHLEAAAAAIAQGVDLRGYFAWSLLDNFEWNSGYAKRFGLVYVDYATQRRVLKDSAHWYRGYITAQRAVTGLE